MQLCMPQATRAAGAKTRPAGNTENEAGLNLLSEAAAHAGSLHAAGSKAAAEAAALPKPPVSRVEQRPLASLTER